MRAGALALDRVQMTPVHTQIPLDERLIVALDVPTVDDAQRIVYELGDSVKFYKVGLGLQFIGGIQLAEELKKQGKKVFLDSKIYDIGATTKAAVQGAVQLGVDFLTVHGGTSVLKEAVAGRGNSSLKLFLITVLTSVDDQDMQEMGYTVNVQKMVEYKVRSAQESRIDGIITSGLEAQMIRKMAGAGLLIVTPGIRSAGIPMDDQKRVSTPEDAIAAGADYIVMGRQIIRSSDRKGEAERVLDKIQSALSG